MNMTECETTVLVPCVLGARNDAAISSHELALAIDAALYDELSYDETVTWHLLYDADMPPVYYSEDTISHEALTWIERNSDAKCVLLTRLTDVRYHESILIAAIRSSKAIDSKKHVRLGRARAVLHVELVNVSRRRLLFADSLHLYAETETHELDGDPAPIDMMNIIQKLAMQAAAIVSESTRSLQHREVITFLRNKMYPSIDSAIDLADEGRWEEAVELMVQETERSGNDAGADVLWYNLGLLRQYAGDYRGSLEAFEHARRIRDTDRYRQAIKRLLTMEDESLREWRRSQ